MQKRQKGDKCELTTEEKVVNLGVRDIGGSFWLRGNSRGGREYQLLPVYHIAGTWLAALCVILFNLFNSCHSSVVIISPL